MSEGMTTGNILNTLVETFTEREDDKKESREEKFHGEDASANSQSHKPFRRDKPVHHILGGGRSADVLLWRNKKISAGVLIGATAVWVFFEWLNYHLLSITCFALIFGMLAQFLWANASGIVHRDPSKIPRLVLPEHLFVNVAKSVAVEVNRALAYLQDVACRGDKKHFLMAVGILFSAAIIGSWCNFLTVLYIGFIAAHTLPVLYERYEDQVDGFVSNVSGQLQHRCGEVLSKIPRQGQLHESKRE